IHAAGVDLSDLQSGADSGWSGSTVYARTKRMQLMITEVWARRLAASGITANAMHTGRAGIMRAMVHRAGLNAEILDGGTIAVGDPVVPGAP
ncbi:MAG: hypothetical protein ACKOTH_10070, partial [Solirubrobacterales bacterium]